MTKSIQNTFYDMSDLEQINYIKAAKKKLKRDGISLFYKMSEIVDKEVLKYEADFYIHDCEVLKEDEGKSIFLWIVRNHGTHLVNLTDVSYNRIGIWRSKEYFDAIFSNYRNQICGYYLIDFKKEKVEKLSRREVLATMAIYEDEAKVFQKLNRRNLSV